VCAAAAAAAAAAAPVVAAVAAVAADAAVRAHLSLAAAEHAFHFLAAAAYACLLHVAAVAVVAAAAADLRVVWAVRHVPLLLETQCGGCDCGCACGFGCVDVVGQEQHSAGHAPHARNAQRPLDQNASLHPLGPTQHYPPRH